MSRKKTTFEAWLRQDGGISLGVASLAVALGVHQSTVWRWLGGYSRPTRKHAKAVEKLTRGDVRARDLLDV